MNPSAVSWRFVSSIRTASPLSCLQELFWNFIWEKSWFYWQMSIENECRNCPSSRKDSRSSDCEVCGCLCVYVCSRGRSNNLLLSKKQQMDLTPLILEVFGPRVVDLTQLSPFRTQWDVMATARTPPGCGSEEEVVLSDWGSTSQGFCASSKEGSKRSYQTALRSQTIKI